MMAEVPTSVSPELAEGFVSYFLDKIKNIRSQIKTQQQSFSILTQPTPVLFHLKGNCLAELSPVFPEELMECIRQSNSKKTCDLDSCPAVLPRGSFPVHLDTVFYMFSSSLQRGISLRFSNWSMPFQCLRLTSYIRPCPDIDPFQICSCWQNFRTHCC